MIVIANHLFKFFQSITTWSCIFESSKTKCINDLSAACWQWIRPSKTELVFATWINLFVPEGHPHPVRVAAAMGQKSSRLRAVYCTSSAKAVPMQCSICIDLTVTTKLAVPNLPVWFTTQKTCAHSRVPWAFNIGINEQSMTPRSRLPMTIDNHESLGWLFRPPVQLWNHGPKLIFGWLVSSCWTVHGPHVEIMERQCCT